MTRWFVSTGPEDWGVREVVKAGGGPYVAVAVAFPKASLFQTKVIYGELTRVREGLDAPPDTDLIISTAELFEMIPELEPGPIVPTLSRVK